MNKQGRRAKRGSKSEALTANYELRITNCGLKSLTLPPNINIAIKDPMQAITQALKEWAVVVESLTAGDTILLLRKGGIRDHKGKFTLAHDRILLYPTYEHQKAQWLKPAYVNLLQSIPPVADPTQLCLKAWAHITHLFEVCDMAQVQALHPFHIWNQQFVQERCQWRPQQPLSLLLLQTYQLSEVVQIPVHDSYRGCRSWIELVKAISIPTDQPVLNDAVYAQQIQAIEEALGAGLSSTVE